MNVTSHTIQQETEAILAGMLEQLVEEVCVDGSLHKQDFHTALELSDAVFALATANVPDELRHALVETISGHLHPRVDAPAATIRSYVDTLLLCGSNYLYELVEQTLRGRSAEDLLDVAVALTLDGNEAAGILELLPEKLLGVYYDAIGNPEQRPTPEASRLIALIGGFLASDDPAIITLALDSIEDHQETVEWVESAHIIGAYIRANHTVAELLYDAIWIEGRWPETERWLDGLYQLT